MTAAVFRSGPRGGLPVVLLHPIATDSRIWAPQLPVLSHRHDVITIDLPGHGAAPAADAGLDMAGYAAHVLGVLDGLGVTQFRLVGLSLGGMVAQAIALQQPERVVGLVLAHTSCVTMPHGVHVWEERLQAFAATGMEGQVAPTLQRWFTPGFAERSPHTLAWVAQMIRNTSAAGYTSAVRAIQRLDHAEALGRLTMPALVIAGEHDLALPIAAATEMAGRLPNGRLLPLPSAHIGNVEQPVLFTEAVAAFLDAPVQA